VEHALSIEGAPLVTQRRRQVGSEGRSQYYLTKAEVSAVINELGASNGMALGH
jgi:hypothetical protein